jgi:uncharacterized lipoprotein
VRFIESWARRGVLGCAAVLAACSAAPSRAPAPAESRPGPAPAAAAAPSATLPAAARARSWDEYRVQASRRIVAANAAGTYMDRPPEPLLAIPVLDVELNRDGSVRRISVQRQPSQATDTVQIAISAVQRAAPFGDVSHLPQPWRFSEVFLFRDDRRFKPRSLDQ